MTDFHGFRSSGAAGSVENRGDVFEIGSGKEVWYDRGWEEIKLRPLQDYIPITFQFHQILKFLQNQILLIQQIQAFR